MSLNSLISALGKHEKSLVIDRQLSSSINQLIPFSQLKNQTNIQNVYWFHNDITYHEAIPVTFILKSSLSNFNTLKNRILQIVALNRDAQIDLVLTDDLKDSLEYLLDKFNLSSSINSVKVWKLYLFENDLLQLNLSEYNSLYQYKTGNLQFKLAKLLQNYLIENPQDRVTNILSKGINSYRFVDDWKLIQTQYINSLDPEEKKNYLRIEKGLYEGLSSGKQCDLIVLERNLDFTSVLLNQLNYLGIIDDCFGIDLNTIKINNETHYLKDFDDSKIFDDIKFSNFGKACDFLNSEAKELQIKYDTLLQNKNLSTNFLQHLQELENLKKQVANHTKISELLLNELKINENSKFNEILSFQQDILFQNYSYSTIVNKIIELIQRTYISENDNIHPIPTGILDILRLLALTNIVYNGFKEKDFNTITNEILESFGIKYLFLLQNLMKTGLLSIRGDLTVTKNFNALNLVNENEDDNEDLSYRGFTPLITKILQQTIKPDQRSSWDKVDLSSIMGKVHEESLIKITANSAKLQQNSKVFIVMIGGITYSELSSVKWFENWFAKKYGVKKEFIVISDGVINARKMIESAL